MCCPGVSVSIPADTQQLASISFIFQGIHLQTPLKGEPWSAVMLYWHDLPPWPGSLEEQGGGWSQQ